MANEVTFSKLAHDITQVSYRDLHALLDSLTELNSDESKARLLDYIASLRHRLIRLLVATRWHMEYSSYHLSAHSLNNIVTNRSANLTNVADTLCAVSATARSAAASASAVRESAEILGSGSFRLPRVIEFAVGLDTLANTKKRTNPEDPPDNSLQPPVKIGSRKNPEETEPEMRVRLETKYAVRVGLPDGISVVSWSADPEHVGVRIGLSNAWHADILLDSPDISKANIRILDFKILVRAHSDAVGPILSSTEDDGALPISSTSRLNLLRLFEDRISWAVMDASKDGGRARAKAGLHCLCMALSRDVCTAIVMRFLREQAVALTRHRAWRKCKPTLYGIGYKEGPEVPLTIEYWRDSPFKAKVSILVPEDGGYIKSDSPSAKGHPHEVVNVTHEPELPAVCSSVQLNLRELSVEELLLTCARRRATHILSRVYEEIKSKTHTISRCVLSTHSAGVETTAIDVAKTGFGLVLLVSLKSGGFAVRLRSGLGMKAFERHPAWSHLQRAAWKGEKHFPDKVGGIVKALQRIVGLQIRMLKDYLFEIQGASADESTVLRWPSGAASVECAHSSVCKKFGIKPPLIGIDNQKFLSAYSWIDFGDNSVLNSFEPKKRVRRSPVNYHLTSDSLLFIQGKQTAPRYLKIDETDLRPRASLSARWSELRHANGLRLRRDLLLRELEYNRLMVSRDADPNLQNSQRTPVDVVKMKLLRASDAYLVLKGSRRWELEMKVGEGLFEESDSTSFVVEGIGVMYKGGENPKLTFAYSDHNSKALSNFRHEYMCALRVANVVQAIELTDLKTLRVLVRNPRYVTVEGYGLECTITLSQASKGHDVRAVFKKNKVPVKVCMGLLELLGEFLDLTREENSQEFLCHLLDQMLPGIVAIERLCIGGVVQLHRVRSALFVQLRFDGTNNQRYLIDVDMRQLIQGTVAVSDCGLKEHEKRNSKQESGNESSTNASKADNNLLPQSNGVSNATKSTSRPSVDLIPRWKASVAQMEEKKIGKMTNAGLMMSIKSLTYFVHLLTGRSLNEQLQQQGQQEQQEQQQ